jgi:hypothetical protein
MQGQYSRVQMTSLWSGHVKIDVTRGENLAGISKEHTEGATNNKTLSDLGIRVEKSPHEHLKHDMVGSGRGILRVHIEISHDPPSL